MAPLFELGRTLMTPGAQEVLTPEQMIDLLHRHAAGDFGSLDEEDVETNQEAIIHGSRILSAYPIDPSKLSKGFGDNTIWIITEAADAEGHRSLTTILLPDEY